MKRTFHIERGSFLDERNPIMVFFEDELFDVPFDGVLPTAQYNAKVTITIHRK